MPHSGYLASNLLHLILMPTEQCNFRCTYCYEDFAHDRMSPRVVAGIKRLLTDPDLHHSLSASGVQHASELFSLQTMLERHEALYLSLLDKRS